MALPPPPDNRIPYTGQLGMGGIAQGNTIAPQDPRTQDNRTQLALHPEGSFSGYPSMNEQQLYNTNHYYYGDAPGQTTSTESGQLQGDPMTDRGAAGLGNDYYPGQHAIADARYATLGGVGPGSATAQQYAGLYNNQAQAMSQRPGAQMNLAPTNMFVTGMGNTLGQANNTGFMQLGNANNLAGTATGAGYQGQLGTAQGLQNLAGQIGQGPSAAELAMRQSNEQGLAGQAALAAGARGGNSALAMRNAASNAAAMNANVNQQVGLQRAQEQATINAQKMQALGAANQGFGAAAGTQQGAYAGAGQQLGQLAGQQLSSANTQLGAAGMYGQLAGEQAKYDALQRSLNDQGMFTSEQMAMQTLENQRNAEMALQNQNIESANTRYGIEQGVGIQARGQDIAQQNQWIGAGTSALAATLPLLLAASDVRMKKDVKKAGDDISSAIRGTDVTYPDVGQMGGGNMPAPTFAARAPMVAQLPQQPIGVSGGRAPMAMSTPNPGAVFGRYGTPTYSPGSSMPASAPAQVQAPTLAQYQNAIAQQKQQAQLAANSPFGWYVPPATSDVRAKKDIKDAESKITDALKNTNVVYPGQGDNYAMPTRAQVFAGQPDGAPVATPWNPYAGRTVAAAPAMPWNPYDATDTRLNAPGYSYQYKNPSAVGATGGTHYGPMAQDLEKTPAGRSVVVDMPNGKKGIDTGRLSLLNTSELSKQRQELDALKAQANSIRGTQVQYPSIPDLPPYRIGGV